MPNVSRMRKVIRRASRFEEVGREEARRSIRPPVWRATVASKVRWYESNQRFLDKAVDNLETRREAIISGSIHLKNINNHESDGANFFVSLLAVLASAGSVPALMAASQVIKNPSLPIAHKVVYGAAALAVPVVSGIAINEKRRARIFTALNGKILVSKKGNQLKTKQLEHNERIYSEVLGAFKVLQSENSSQLDQAKEAKDQLRTKKSEIRTIRSKV